MEDSVLKVLLASQHVEIGRRFLHVVVLCEWVVLIIDLNY